MGPVEFIFLTVFAIFGVVGVIRGYGRELGVTTMLFIVLFVLELADERYQTQLMRVLRLVASDEAGQLSAQALLYCAIILAVTFISYEGETLSFPGKRGRIFFDLGSGLLNGYLFAGSLWYYLHAANWPVFHPTAPFTTLYNTVVRFLPPAVFEWPYLIGLALIMLIARIWK